MDFQVFKDLLRQLLQGKALSVEDVVDLLTLKDNTMSIEDYASSLHLLKNVKVGGLLDYYITPLIFRTESSRRKKNLHVANRLAPSVFT